MENLENSKNEKIETDLLLQAIYLKYGYDFRSYAKASIRRRIRNSMAKAGLKTISELQHKLIYDRDFFDKLLKDLTVNVTEMFRDPPFFKALRDAVIPELKKKEFIKVWHAGCATGEEVYSLVIILNEEGIKDKVRVYATDVDESVLAVAKKGVYPISALKGFTTNYQKTGGVRSFADYYTSQYDLVLMAQQLKKNIVFANHNLVTDDVFGEMDLIVCRNVMIYFNRDLQERVFRLFHNSLCAGGFLCLGAKETIRFSDYSKEFENVVKNQRIYRKKGEEN